MNNASLNSQNVITLGWVVGGNSPNTIYFYAGATNTGYVQYSNTIYPLMTLSESSTPIAYGTEYWQGNWWLWYDTQWFGYFPASGWDYGSFTQSNYTYWEGFVYSTSNTPCTAMGNGIRGRYPGSAQFTNMYFINGTLANGTPYASNPNFYDYGNVTGHSFKYGGPGNC